MSSGFTRRSRGAWILLSLAVVAAGATAPSFAATLSGTPPATVQPRQFYQFTPVTRDVRNRRARYTIANRPSWAYFSSSRGSLYGVPRTRDIGVYSNIVITVTDGRSMARLGPFSITVGSSVPPPTTTPPPTPTNTPPTLSGDPATSALVGQTYMFTPAAADAEGDALTFSIDGMPTWARFSPSTGLLSGTPTSANIGTASGITISVSDGKATTALAPFSIAVQDVAAPDRAPTISGSPMTSIAAGTAYSFRPTASDPDGNPLTFSIVSKPVWAAFDSATGRLSGTPTVTSTTSGITISVSDGQLSATLPAFALQVTAAPNRTPTISGAPGTTATVGTAYSFAPAASDADGDTLTYSIQNKPTWATFSASGRLTGTPVAANVGTTSGIVISVSDGKASVSLAPFSIQVQAAPNRAPTISGAPATTATVGTAYSFRPSATDPDSDPLTFSIANAPSWLTFSPTTGQLSGTPAAADVGTSQLITIRVSDGKATTALPAFVITVSGGATTGSASLSWTPPQQNTDGTALVNLAGYRIIYGTSPTSLTQTIQVANPGVTTYLVEDLAAGTWYFSIKSYNSAGGESAPTSPVSTQVP